MPNKTALLKIILLYLLCFAYIWAMDMAEFVVFASDYHQFVIAEGVLKIIFYMAVILLVYFISQEKTGSQHPPFGAGPDCRFCVI